ncbi:HNH endonuclease [Spirosoma areae]
MAKRKPFEVDLLAARTELIELIENFIALSTSDELRQKVLTLVPAFYVLRRFGSSVIPNTTAGRDRLLIYLRKYPMTVIDSDELMVVSGITDYQRRIRELRVELGWPILSGQTIKALLKDDEWDNTVLNVSHIKPDEYILIKDQQDRDAAHRWKLSNSIRKEDLGVQEKLIKYLRLNVGREVLGEELAYIAKNGGDWPRRTRELRTQLGWPVKTKASGRPDLPMGVYILEENKQAETHDRNIKDDDRVAVLVRDDFKCRKCGWSQDQAKTGDPRHFLELHHLTHHAKGGKNEIDNLVTLCNVHHDTIHSRKMDQAEVLEWLNITHL